MSVVFVIFGALVALAVLLMLGLCRAAGDADALAEARWRDLNAREAEDARVQARRLAAMANDLEQTSGGRLMGEDGRETPVAYPKQDDELERLWLSS